MAKESKSAEEKKPSGRSISARVHCPGCNARLVRNVKLSGLPEKGKKTLDDCPRCCNEEGQTKQKLIFDKLY
jgi:hypothetical protein